MTLFERRCLLILGIFSAVALLAILAMLGLDVLRAIDVSPPVMQAGWRA